MRPQDAYNELTLAPVEIKGLDSEPANVDGLHRSINRSYFLLRRWIAIVALALPFSLWAGGAITGWAAGHGLVLMPNPSMSEYYHNAGGWLRDLFVGSLFAIGFFLYFYKGYTAIEDMVLNLAGIGAVGVAMAPMAWDGPNAAAAYPRLLPESLHGPSAAALFLFVGYICIFQSKKTLALLKNKAARRRFKQIYVALGTMMVAIPASIAALHFVFHIEHSRWIFALEATGIGIFAAYWLVKSREIDRILKQ